MMNNTFIDATQGFTVSGASTANYGSACSTYYVVGGPSNFGSGSYVLKNYTGLKAHFRARVTFFFLKIGNWNNQNVTVTADTVNIPTSVSFSSTMDSTVMKLCGNSSYTEAIRPVDVVFSHNSSTLELEIATDLTVDSSVASWGIYDLSVSIDVCNAVYCETCDAPTASDCLSCISSLFLQTSPGPSTCQSLCPDGDYSDSSTKTCPTCNSSCTKCSGPSSNECLSCPNSMYLLVLGGTFTCVSSCPSNYYSDSDNNCLPCDATCTTCNGGLPTNCLVCTLPRYFMGGLCVYQCPSSYFGDNSTATCILNCQDTTFGYNVSKICCPCNNCQTCSGFGANQCISCTGTQLLQDNTCVTNCSANYFLNQAASTCDGNDFISIIIFFFPFILNINNYLKKF